MKLFHMKLFIKVFLKIKKILFKKIKNIKMKEIKKKPRRLQKIE